MPDQTTLGPDELAATVRKKFPGKYVDKSNDDLAKAWLQKYPVYWKNVDAAAFAKKGMYQPASTGTHPVSTGEIMKPGTNEPRGESGLAKDIHNIPSLLSPGLATAGAAVGAMAGPPGAMAGAAAGGGAGQALADKITTGKVDPGATYDAAVGQGLLESAGMGLSKVLEKVGKSAGPKVLKALNNYIGLKPADLPKWGRTVEDADKIGATVLKEAGVKKTLEAQRDAIEMARLAHDQATVKIVAHPAGKITDFHAVAIDRGVKLLDEVEKEGVPQEQINAIDKNLKGITDNLKENMTPSELLDAKRSIQKQITDWNRNTTNIRQRYLQGLYGDINDAIVKALPSDAAKDFRLHNLIQTHLITAREAATEKLLARQLKETPGLVTSIVQRAGGAGIGALSGATIAGETGQNKEHGAIVGGLIGAGLGSYGRHVGKMELPAADIAVQRAIAKAAPKLSKAARSLPVVTRAVESVIDSIQSRPQNGP